MLLVGLDLDALELLALELLTWLEFYFSVQGLKTSSQSWFSSCIGHRINIDYVQKEELQDFLYFSFFQTKNIWSFLMFPQVP